MTSPPCIVRAEEYRSLSSSFDRMFGWLKDCMPSLDPDAVVGCRRWIVMCVSNAGGQRWDTSRSIVCTANRSRDSMRSKSIS